MFKKNQKHKLKNLLCMESETVNLTHLTITFGERDLIEIMSYIVILTEANWFY